MRLRCLDPIDDPSYRVLYELVLRIARFGFKNGPRSNLRAFNFSGRTDSPSCCVVVVIYPPQSQMSTAYGLPRFIIPVDLTHHVR